MDTINQTFRLLENKTGHMIVALGIDSIEISRFKNWYTFDRKKLRRTFSEQEITYCLQIPAKSAERFAVRFAAKEAFFKALCQAYPTESLNLFKIVRECQISKKNNLPALQVNWENLQLQPLSIVLSITHTRDSASTAVILQKLQETFDYT